MNMKTHSNNQFDFTLLFNDNIVCKRFFKCNNFYEKYIDFGDSIEIITLITNLIEKLLKSETINLLWLYHESNSEKVRFYKNPTNESLVIIINYNSNFIASSYIMTCIYPPKVKFNINIRPIIPEIINCVQLYLDK